MLTLYGQLSSDDRAIQITCLHCAGALQAIIDVMNTLAAAAVATQMIVLGGSVFMPSGGTSSTGSAARAQARSTVTPLTLVKRQPSDPATPFNAQLAVGESKPTTKQLTVGRQLGDPSSGEFGSKRGESRAQQAQTSQPRASIKGGPGFLQMLLPSDAADRKVSGDQMQAHEPALKAQLSVETN